VFLASLPYPENAVLFHYDVAKYLVLEFNISTVVAVAWWLYFLVLEPSGAVSPSSSLSGLPGPCSLHVTNSIIPAPCASYRTSPKSLS
jgi:hypothetical protein